MSTSDETPAAAGIAPTVAFVEYLLSGYTGADFTVRLWDGTVIPAQKDAAPAFQVTINDPGVIRDMFFPPGELKTTESFFTGRIDIEGDLICAIESAQAMLLPKLNVASLLTMLRLVLALPSSGGRTAAPRHIAAERGPAHSLQRDKESVSFHYDVSNDFYSLWLDPRLVYSGAYFDHRDQSLADAQVNKLDILCRSLRLREGQTLLDIGCGWGSFIMHAAKHYGVRCLGVTLSKEQAAFANKRIAEEGLSSLCTVEVKDYRELDPRTAFDRITSIEMLHHVGGNQLPAFFTTVSALLKDQGLCSFIAITRKDGPRFHNPAFAKRYFMPDYHLVTIGELLRYAEQARFEITDLESLREHYYLTARHWLSNLEQNHDAAVGFVDEAVHRVWRLSFALMAFGFKTNLLQFYRCVLFKGAGKHFPATLTRGHLYPGTPRSE